MSFLDRSLSRACSLSLSLCASAEDTHIFYLIISPSTPGTGGHYHQTRMPLFPVRCGELWGDTLAVQRISMVMILSMPCSVNVCPLVSYAHTQKYAQNGEMHIFETVENIFCQNRAGETPSPRERYIKKVLEIAAAQTHAYVHKLCLCKYRILLNTDVWSPMGRPSTAGSDLGVVRLNSSCKCAECICTVCICSC